MCRIEGFECILPCQVIPRQEFLYSALLVAVSYGVESGGETGERIDTVELTRLCRPANYAECVFWQERQTVRSEPVWRVAVVW
ncbi:hypothetical protein GGE61_007203, partial [Rhizobium leguminosarum]|nr:hypothetical protein [Rhizobium leguminosarum]